MGTALSGAERGNIMERLMTSAAVTAALAVALAGCGDDDDAAGSGGATVEVTLEDFDIALSDTTVPAGPVTMEVQNDGPSVHEFVVFETDLAPDELPTENGDVAESDDFAPVDEIEDIEPGASPALSLDLEPGHYVAICNLPGHYRQGMASEFTVE